MWLMTVVLSLCLAATRVKAVFSGERPLHVLKVFAEVSKLPATIKAFPLVSEPYLSPFNTLLRLALHKAAAFPAEPNELT